MILVILTYKWLKSCDHYALNSHEDVILKELYDFLDATILVQTDAEVLNQPI